ncbi:MAG: TetR/AcrR family transcriptional regulator [Sphingobacteriia bacterium]|nr:TetR/AcrR family transcriptional regulator [Sphingobacteriia bacterium]
MKNKKTLIEFPCNKRDQIIKAAEHLFLNNGFSTTSMEIISHEAKVSKATLYNYFDSKEMLFAHVIKNRCETFASLLSENLKEDRSLKENLIFIGKSFLNKILDKDSINLFRIIVSESKHFPELSQAFFNNGVMKGTEVIANFLMEKGKVLNISDYNKAAEFFLTTLIGHLHLKATLGVLDNNSNIIADDFIIEKIELFLRCYE